MCSEARDSSWVGEEMWMGDVIFVDLVSVLGVWFVVVKICEFGDEVD